ncbi:hypothetical protein [uncultured Paraglaciecola sp.]|uniref:hypothetical protein n=1 Tax=uncultured Paraglaciecola sp. TaxID=1765024 RepID=UPI00262922E9|nr:hypothetical protein [uncultured Paraglaciecola sp.]
MSLNPLNDGTKSGTFDNLASLLRHIESVSDDSEVCDPGLHLVIKMASATARQLQGFDEEKESTDQGG